MKNLVVTTVKLLFSILLVSIMFSCEQNDDNLKNINLDDKELIDAIKSSINKQTINLSDLPLESVNTLKQAYADKYTSNGFIAPDLGYEISVRVEKGATVGVETSSYFDLKGRELKAETTVADTSTTKFRYFDYVYPVSFTMPNGSVVKIENDEGWEAIEKYYVANPDTMTEPVPVYPVNIKFENGELRTVKTAEEMKKLGGAFGQYTSDGCEYYDFKLPISFKMPDGSILKIEKDADWDLLDKYYEANQNATTEPELQFPITVILSDKTTKIINTEAELIKLEESLGGCYDDYDDYHGDGSDIYFDFVLPVTVIMPDKSEIKVEKDADWDLVEKWYVTNKDSTQEPDLKYPVTLKLADGTTKVINNKEEMEKFEDSLFDDYEDDYFDFVLPVTVIMPDKAEIKVEKDADWDAIFKWYDANPNSTEDITFKYPITVKFPDGKTQIINSEEELIKLENSYGMDEGKSLKLLSDLGIQKS